MENTASTEDGRGSDIELAYCRAALYSALAIGFRYPEQDGLDRLLTPESKACLSSAAAELYPTQQRKLLSAIRNLPPAAGVESSALASLHRRLFGHTAHGLVPPYETEYGNEAVFQQPQELGDLMGFYRAFGLGLKDAGKERPDHVSCEFEFLMFLALKEAYALENNERELLAETRKAEKLFVRDHLARFLPAFANKLSREDSNGFYGRLAELCLCVITAECTRWSIPCGPANLGLRPADDSRVPMACGNGAECGLAGAGPSEEADLV